MRLFGLFLGFYIAWWSAGQVTAKQDGTPPPKAGSGVVHTMQDGTPPPKP